MEDRNGRRHELIVLGLAAVIFLGCVAPPPHLMDDVDAVQAQIARNMLDSGDWVTARLDGVAYLEKSPLIYWMIAVSYILFGVHDWAARLPIALSIVALCWLVTRIGRWAFGGRAGLYAGLALTASTGLWLFTRVLIPDVVLTLTIALALWAMLRALEDGEPHPRAWALTMWAAIAAGLLLKGLIAAVFPAGAAFFYFLTGREWGRLRRLEWIWGPLLALAIAAPWHVRATRRNPPYLAFTMHSGPGEYRGFFWFYFFNEHILRFLNLRYPRDYATMARWWFWLSQLVWLFPFSVFLPAVGALSYRGPDRASRLRRLCLCWAAFVMAFFTLSTTQEYYSMPAYPAFALLLGGAMASDHRWLKPGSLIVGVLVLLAGVGALGLLIAVWNTPAPGDIAHSLTQNPELYTLSLGHVGDLTIKSFAYLKLPLAIAAIAFAVGAFGALRYRAAKTFALLAVMMVILLHAARIAMQAFDPYLGSYPLAAALKAEPPGRVVIDDPYYEFSSIFFYTNTTALLLNGRVNNLEYGSYAPGAPHVFIADADFPAVWRDPARTYLLAEGPRVPPLERLVGKPALHLIKESGGKFLFSNQ